MSENLIESKPLSEYAGDDEKARIEQNIRRAKDPPRPPDYVSNEHSACAWVRHYNQAGQPIELNVKIGDFYFTLKKRFL